MNYLNLDDLLALHDNVIEQSGGLSGVRDLGLLESILEHIQNDIYYPDFYAKLVHLIYSINKAHAFNDGNKRASIIAGAYFLMLNGWEDDIVEIFTETMEDVAVDVAANFVNKEQLATLIVLTLATYQIKIQAA